EEFADGQCETGSCATEDLWWDSRDEREPFGGGLAEELLRGLAEGLRAPPAGLPAGGGPAGQPPPVDSAPPGGGPLPPGAAAEPGREEAAGGVSKPAPELTPATSRTVHFDVCSESSDSDSDSSVTRSGRGRRPRCGPRFFSLCDSDSSEDLGLEACGDDDDDEYAGDWTVSLSKAEEQCLTALPSPGL
ncbi:unnamed protein product, partial [Prorocentrum cordatum]